MVSDSCGALEQPTDHVLSGGLMAVAVAVCLSVEWRHVLSGGLVTVAVTVHCSVKWHHVPNGGLMLCAALLVGTMW